MKSAKKFNHNNLPTSFSGPHRRYYAPKDSSGVGSLRCMRHMVPKRPDLWWMVAGLVLFDLRRSCIMKQCGDYPVQSMKYRRRGRFIKKY